MISESESLQCIRAAVVARIEDLKDELSHWMGELEKLNGGLLDSSSIATRPSGSRQDGDKFTVYAGGQ